MVSNLAATFRLTLEPSSGTSDVEDVSSEYEDGEDEGEELPAESDTEGGEEVSESISESSEDIPVSSMEVPVYYDTELLESLTVIDARLQDTNSNLAIIQEQNAFQITMGMWALVVAGGILISYLFYSIAKKFI